MPFIGNQPALSYTSFAKQDFTTSATTSYTLDNPVTNENEIALFINFVRQEPTTAYTASVYINDGANDIYLVKDAPIPSGSALQVLDGGAKFVVQSGDRIYVQSDTASSLDVWVSTVDAIST